MVQNPGRHAAAFGIRIAPKVCLLGLTPRGWERQGLGSAYLWVVLASTPARGSGRARSGRHAGVLACLRFGLWSSLCGLWSAVRR